MFSLAKKRAESKAYDNLQDFIRELMREKLFDCDKESLNGNLTYFACKDALARNWLVKEEDDAWEQLQKKK